MQRQSSISPPPLKRTKLCETQPERNRADALVVECRLTIYSWNINGISPFVQPRITAFFRSREGSENTTSSTPDLRNILRNYGWPTLFLLQEVKINPEDTATQRALVKAVQPAEDASSKEPSYQVFFSLPSDPHNARGFGRKIYGVCTLIRQDFAKRVVKVREVDWDVEGRFLVCETSELPSTSKLAIVNVYGVNGTDAPYRDPHSGRPAGTRHDRKLEVHRLLQKECQALEANGFGVIVAGDLNIARKPIDGHPKLRSFPEQHVRNRADFEARFFDTGQFEDASSPSQRTLPGNQDGLGFVDTFRSIHRATRRGFTYYPRGKVFGESCDRVDMILISRRLESQLCDAGICETVADRGPSDHVPLWCTLRSE